MAAFNQNISKTDRGFVNSFVDVSINKVVSTRSSVTTDRVFLCNKKEKQKEETMMNNHFLVKTLVKYFGETQTIKMLNQLQKRKVSKKAKRYKAKLKLEKETLN